MNGKYITDWSIIKYPNDIYGLIINTTEKWLAFHRYNNTDYIVGEDTETEGMYEELSVPEEFIPHSDEFIFICSSNQNKDQITFYWIPFTKDSIINHEIILTSKI